MRILTTGGSGFLGLALTRALAARGDDVLDLSVSPPPEGAADGRVEHRAADLRDDEAVDRAVAEARPGLVVHMAAATPDAAREAADGAAAILDANVGGTARVVEAAARHGVARVVAVSSTAVYGRTLAEAPVLREEMAPRPAMLYAISKAAAEAVALRLGAVRGVAVCVPRVGILWGAWERRHELRTTPSPPFAMFEAARAGRDVVLPFAATAPLCHVERAVAALLALVEAPGAEGPVNVGGTRALPLLAFAEAVAARYGVTARIDPEAPNVPLFAADRPPMDHARLRRLTGHVMPDPDPAAEIARHASWLDAHL